MQSRMAASVCGVQKHVHLSAWVWSAREGKAKASCCLMPAEHASEWDRISAGLQKREAHIVEIHAAGQRHVGVLQQPDDVLGTEEHIVDEQHTICLPLPRLPVPALHIVAGGSHTPALHSAEEAARHAPITNAHWIPQQPGDGLSAAVHIVNEQHELCLPLPCVPILPCTRLSSCTAFSARDLA